MTKIQKISLVTGGVVSAACGLALWSALENMTRDDINRLSDYIATDYLQYNETWKTIVFRLDRALIKSGCYFTAVGAGPISGLFFKGITEEMLKAILKIVTEFQKKN